MKNDLPVCPACREGHLHTATRTRSFRPHGRAVEVELLTSRCDHCGVETTRASQHTQNLQRLAARKAQYGNVLLGEEILALRKRYGLTQQAAAKVFGKGKIAFSRYENEVSYPDESTTLLLQLAIEQASVLKLLADKAGVEVPLWPERCEDEQLKKVHVLTQAYAASPADATRHNQIIVHAHSHSLRRIAASDWAAPMASVRQTFTLVDACNDERMESGAFAS